MRSVLIVRETFDTFETQTSELCSGVLLVGLMVGCMLLAHLYSVSRCYEFETPNCVLAVCKAAGRLLTSSWQTL